MGTVYISLLTLVFIIHGTYCYNATEECSPYVKPTSDSLYDDEYVEPGNSNVCNDSYAVITTVPCIAGTCDRTVTCPSFRCCDGWSAEFDGQDSCPAAICDGKIGSDACNERAPDGDAIITSSSRIESGNGDCSAPDTCTNCADGFYGDGASCTICPKINNCNFRNCSSLSDNTCEYCEGVILERKYWRAYTNEADGKLTCQQTCSWRSNSTRCYPGTCADELASNCLCTTGFSGTHCQNIDDQVMVAYNEGKLKTEAASIVDNPVDPNTQATAEVWTNEFLIEDITMKFTSTYTITAPSEPADPTGENHYVTAFSVGIIDGSTSYKIINHLGVTEDESIATCSGVTTDSPAPPGVAWDCTNTLRFSTVTTLLHNYTLSWSYTVKNGGYVEVMDREDDNRTNRYYYNGQETTFEFSYRIDVEDPYHNGTNPLIAPDLTNSSMIEISWDDWVDDLSGVDHFTYTLYDRSRGLRTQVISPTNVASTDSSVSFSIPSGTSGLYEVIFTCYDVANNHKSARRLFIFDDISSVAIVTANPIIITGLPNDTIWVVQDSISLVISWTSHFENTNHRDDGWLDTVADITDIDRTSMYDDNFGTRTVDSIDHEQGLVAFEVRYVVYESEGVATQDIPYTAVTDIHTQSQSLTGITFTDGEKLEISIKAYDIMGQSNEDSKVYYRDTTPPEIQDLRLKNSAGNDTYILGSVDFTQMRMQWTAFDNHSGIDTLFWRIYDFANDSQEHGKQYILAQGGVTVNLTTCEDTYALSPVEYECYCTSFWGCYNKIYQVTPTTGLYAGKESGIHDYDYYIEVEATNKAGLVTTVRTKISIDTTPPHVGAVHDGLQGQNEVDYQQGRTLNAHWSGFFDRESGVLFYQYGFSNSCLAGSDFMIQLPADSEIQETTNTYASETMNSDGKYYVTVVAYNQAYEHSEPLCSDGVTVDQSTSSVKEVQISNARILGGLITDSDNTTYWILADDRTRREIINSTSDCGMKATMVADIDLLPIKRDTSGSNVQVDGAVFCANSSGAPTDLTPVMAKSSMMEIEWTPVTDVSGVYGYEVGIASTANSPAPDLISFQSTWQNPNYRIQHSDLPIGFFYITIKTITKANVENIQSIRCSMDSTPPTFSGTIAVTFSNDTLVATWGATDFDDPQDPFDLEFEYAVGHSQYWTDILPYRSLQSSGPCTVDPQPTCTGIDINELPWQLHGHHSYYVTVKATNRAGLFHRAVSSAYVYDVQAPSEGVVIDIEPGTASTDIPYVDIEDIDFQTSTGSIAARWRGFSHPHLTVTYEVTIGTTAGGTDILLPKSVGTVLMHVESGLTLMDFVTYYFTVTATTSAGSTSVTSDGVTITPVNAALTGITVNDGKDCNLTADVNLTMFTHHDEDNRRSCEADIDTQASLSTIKAYWTIPDNMRHYTTDIFFKIEEETPAGGSWITLRDYVYLGSQWEVSVDDLTLSPGKTYRVTIKPCARSFCFQPISSDGVLTLANNPTAGALLVEHTNHSGASEKLVVTFDLFYDPDVSGDPEKYQVVDKYEYAITDSSSAGNLHTNWETVTYAPTGTNKGSFEVLLQGTMDFTRCRKVALRGYNKVRKYTTISADVKDCAAIDPANILARFIVDAYGESYNADRTLGQKITLEENSIWAADDVDYTPYKNILSAVWHSGRYSWYTWAVLKADTIDVTTYYNQVNQLTLPDPCSSAEVVHGKCGNTTDEFVNVIFDTSEYLEHGKRYVICIHANAETIVREEWTQELGELSMCTDGVIVDLTNPVARDVWIGNIQGTEYQTETTDLYVNWESFLDVEEFGVGRHTTGISYYVVSVGTTSGGNDIVDTTNLGVVNHAHFGGLMLQSGHKYYASVTGYDFAGRNTTKTSDAVIVDATPPVTTDVHISLSSGRHLTSDQEVSACWPGVFSDIESDIDYYQWAVGSMPTYNDVMSYATTTDTCGTSAMSSPLNLLEGHSYFINVRATNKAGLSTTASSWAYIMDKSPPVAGHVYDGVNGSTPSQHNDLDFQTHLDYLAAYWEGFYEPQTTIKEYYIRIGTCAGCDDVIVNQPIGIVEEFKVTSVSLATGVRYYATVTACNTADLCMSVTSDGIVIDTSPPTPGRVWDGTLENDVEFQASKKYIAARWYGFVDPQSGLDKYVWKVGTTVGGDNIVNAVDLNLGLEVVVTEISSDLPVGTRIYVTIGCYNKAGLYAESSSNGFIVDDSKPSITKAPVFPTGFGAYGDTSVQVYQNDRTAMKVEWAVEDPTSYVERQYLAIKSHIGGEFQTSSIKVNGIVRDYIFTGLDLHDGVKYYVTLICCNGAQLCSETESQAIIVDTTPPSRGMFAIATDHASNLTRHITNWMTWQLDYVALTWIGFNDLHSEIDHYAINVGVAFLGSDLNEIPEEPFIVSHNSSGDSYQDEGPLQRAFVPTQSLTAVDYFYVTLWAVNKAGLSSGIIHSQFLKVPGGTIWLVRRCNAYSCEGHCICVPQDQGCEMSNCTDDTLTRVNDLLQVLDVAGDGTVDIDYSASNTVLKAMWSVVLLRELPPLWYQWSVGLENKDLPEGVFDQSTDVVWHDVPSNVHTAIYTADRDFVLMEDVKYSFFLRVWFSDSVYGIFKSDGVTISTTVPTPVIQNGVVITEVQLYSTVRDMDYIKQGSHFTVDWTNKFVDAANLILKYRLYISTYPGGTARYGINTDLSATTTNYDVIGATLTPGIRYYSNVVAYNHAGLYHTETSDGFTIDAEPPIKGTVRDGIGLHDLQYQNNSDTVGASWHGFSDQGSGVTRYMWCVGTTNTITGSLVCDILPWENVGLHVQVSRRLQTPITDCGYNKVYAVDIVGYASEIAVSDGFCIDLTSPTPNYLFTESENLLSNNMFSDSADTLDFTSINTTNDVCSGTIDYSPTNWTVSTGGCAIVVNSSHSHSRNNHLFLRGSISQNLVISSGLYRATFVTSHLTTSDSTSANKEGFIEMADQRYVFLLYTKPYRHDGHGASTREIVSWHNHTFYFNLSITQSTTMEIGSLDGTTGIFIDDVKLQLTSLNTTNTVGSANVPGHVVFVQEWGSVHASWSFVNQGPSSVVDYAWAIGYATGSTQIQGYISTGLRNYGYNNNVTLVHNTLVYITVIARNMVGNLGIAHSEEVLVDLTAPIISEVNDGEGSDEDTSEIQIVYANWNVQDAESGLESCYWAIGFSPGGTDLKNFEEISVDIRSGQLDISFADTDSQTIYNTIRCTNKAGLTTEKSSDGIRISMLKPNASEAQITHVGLSETEYSPLAHYQSVNDTVRLFWSGFIDNYGIALYHLQIDLPNSTDDFTSCVDFADEQVVKYVNPKKLELTAGLQEVQIQAINKLNGKSDPVYTNFTVFQEKPMKSSTILSPTVTWDATAKQIDVNWDNIFFSDHPLRYEVSAGLAEGGGEVLQWQETSNTELRFGFPPHIDDYAGYTIYIYIRGISAGGYYDDIKGTVDIP